MKKLFNLAVGICGVICLILVGGAAGFAQATNGTIAGSVVDAAQAAVVGATVTATSLATGEKRTATTNKVGSYRIESVLPGAYKVEVTADTFSPTTADDVVVNASVVTSVNVTLKTGTKTELVEVKSDEVEALKTDSGELSDTLSNVEVSNLPISTLNPYQLAVTLPGVTTVTGDNYTNGFGFSVNGNRPRDNNFLVEGTDNNDQSLHGQAWQPENLEAIQEITFLVDSFSAEYGRGGSVSNLVLKGGSNQFHGAAYELLLNSALDGEDKGDILNQVPKQKSRENIFGFRVGGPVVRNRWFFFVSNIWDRYRATANLGVLTLPTASGYAALQAYSTNPRIANLLTAYGSLRGTNPLYATTVNLGVDPVSGANRGVVNFAGAQRALGDDENSRELEATSDVIISDSDKLHFRFIQAPYAIPFDVGNFNSQLPGFDTSQGGGTYNAGIIYTHIFSPYLLNELRPAWSRIGFSFYLPASTLANPLTPTPEISITGITGYGIPAGDVPQGRYENTYQLQDTLTWIKGSHTMKFGFDVEDQRIRNLINFNYYGAISFSAQAGGYTALANYLDNYGGTASSGSATINYGNPVARPAIWEQSYFAEDTWKIAHNFTLDFGLRYEYYGAPFNYLPNPAFNPNNPAAFPGGVPELPNDKDFGPRAGFNYAFNDKTVVSGGVGFFYSHIFTNITNNIQGSSPNNSAKDIITSSSGRGTPNWSTILATTYNTPASQLPLATDTSNVIPQRLLEPLTYEYNLRVQRELPAAFVLAVEYVGSRTEHQYATTEFNPFLNDIFSAARLFPTRGRIIRQDNTADANYNSGQIELQHKVRWGLTFRGAYTYSKLLDDGSEEFTDSSANLSTYAELQYPNNRRREYAASAFDHRNRIVVSAVYQPPVWHSGEGLHWAGAVVNGWTFSGISTFQSGQPINVEIGYDWNGDGISNDRPILLNPKAPIQNWAIKGDDPIIGFGLAPGTLCDGPAWWATSDNCHPVTAANTHWVTSYFGSTQNTVSRNSLFADHQSNTDVTVERAFHTFEHQDFQFGVQALNVFNHGPTGSYDSQLIDGVPYNGTDMLGNVYSGAVTFGNKAITVAGSRTLRIQARYEF